MKVVNYVTGYNGFLGTHLVNRLETFSPIPHTQIDSIKLDTFDKFFFLSTYGNMAYHHEDGLIVKANLLDLISILNQIDFNKTFKSFVFISTSSVKLKTQTMYSRTKKAAEEILLSYMEKYNVPICIIRPFSITGVGEQKEHLIPTLIRSCMTGESINFVSSPVHDYIDVEDVVDGILNLSSHSAKGIFELGSGIKTSNAEVLKLVEKVTGKKANIKEVASLRVYDNNDWVSANFKSTSWGWRPAKTLEQSITEMVNRFKENEQIYLEQAGT